MPDRLFIPPHITTVAEAHKSLGVTPGSTVYLKVTCGDYNADTKQSVTLQPGHVGIIDEVYLSGDIWWKVRIKILDPLAQPFLIWSFEDFPKSWTLNPEGLVLARPPLSWHQRVDLDKLGELMS